MAIPIPDYFEFSDYEKAFALFYRVKAADDSLCLVISTQHPYVSGYWIEKIDQAASDDVTFVYRTINEARALEMRVREAIRKAGKSHAVGYVVV